MHSLYKKSLSNTTQLMQLHAFVDTGNPWLDKKIQLFIESFVQAADGKLTGLAFLEEAEAAGYTSKEDSLAYFFCNPTGIAQTIVHRAASTFMLSFFASVNCWVDKDKLAILADYWARKRPNSILKTNFPETVCFDLDYADFLEDKLDDPDLYFLRQSLLQNECNSVDKRDWWILKPAMTAGGYGIRLFSSIDELEGCFEKLPDDDTIDTLSDVEDHSQSRLRSSQLRNFVAQRYVASIPLLNGRKFHIRAYVLVMGRLRVFVHREMFVILAPHEYAQPWHPDAIRSSLTNTSLQKPHDRTENVRPFWTTFTDDAWKRQTFEQIGQITAEIFEAGVAGTASHFSIHPHCFDFFALDFMVDLSGKVWLLEVNSGPKVHEEGKAGELMQHVFKSVVYTTLGELTGEDIDGAPGIVEVLSKDMGTNVPCFPMWHKKTDDFP